MSSSRALHQAGALVIRGGYVLTMDPAAGDFPAADVHIAGGQIAAVGPDLAVPEGTPELDAAGMIVAPGLVDTHWHMWNTLLRSMSADHLGPGYFKVMVGAGRAFGPDDIYQGTRLACAEAVSSGITTVHDWCHNVRGPGYAEAGLRALAEAGLRARYSYGVAAGHPNDQAMDLPEVTGSITPGKRADVICVATGGPNLAMLTDPAHMLVTAAQPANVDTVIVDGRVLKRGGTLTAVDLPQAREDARRALSGVLARAAS